MEHLLGFIQSAIHRNERFSYIDKFNYLNSALKAATAHAIQGLTLTEVNYEATAKLSQEHFGQTQQVISAHMDFFSMCHHVLMITLQSLDTYTRFKCVHSSGLALLTVSAVHYSLTHLIPKCPLAHRASSGSIWKSLNSNHYVQIATRD